MTLSVAVYGFGSAFKDSTRPADVDLLIIHAEMDREHCLLANLCRRLLQQGIPEADVTVLSAAEERHFQFIRTARAFHFGGVRKSHLKPDIEEVRAEILRNLAAM